MKRLLTFVIIGILCCLAFFSVRTEAGIATSTFESSDEENDCQKMRDGNYFTKETLKKGTTLTIVATEPITGVYMIWDQIPGPWVLKDGTESVSCGQNGFLQEWVSLSGNSKMISITVSQDELSIADIYVISGGEIPEYVHLWKPSQTGPVDVLFYAAEEGDERNYFQNLIPKDVKVQAAYFTNHFPKESFRNHILLNNLWNLGFDYYPILGNYTDFDADSLEEMRQMHLAEAPQVGVSETVSRLQPQVLVYPDYPDNADYNRLYAEELIREAAANVPKPFPVTEHQGLSSQDVMSGVYSYEMQAEKAARIAERAANAPEIPEADVETDKKAGRSLKYLLFIIAAIALILIITDIIIISVRRYRKTRRIRKAR